MPAVSNPYTGETLYEYSAAEAQDVDNAVTAVCAAYYETRHTPASLRADLLARLAEGVFRRRADFALAIAREAGKPIVDSRVEVDRAIQTLTLSSEEAKRIGGEYLPLDLTPASSGRWGLTRRFPVGPIAAISPFNFPLNLGMHKVGPGIASGNAVVWKPPLQAPGAAILFADLFAVISKQCGYPADALRVIFPPDPVAERLVADPRIRMVSFTGSARVGWNLRARAGTKKVALELGGNAGAVIGADCDLDYAVERCLAGGFGYAGQTCISVQRILIEEPAYDRFVARLVEGARTLSVGDPLDETVKMGPVISEKEALRLETWINEAAAAGARILAGGTRQGLMWQPTVVSDVPANSSLYCEEAFGPVVIVSPFAQWDEALDCVNDTRYGLQAGVFTRDIGRVFRAFERLEVGGVIVNDVPTYRSDSMPYGGIKDSGSGREGVRSAIEDMTELKLLVMNSRA